MKVHNPNESLCYAELWPRYPRPSFRSYFPYYTVLWPKSLVMPPSISTTSSQSTHSKPLPFALHLASMLTKSIRADLPSSYLSPSTAVFIVDPPPQPESAVSMGSQRSNQASDFLVSTWSSRVHGPSATSVSVFHARSSNDGESPPAASPSSEELNKEEHIPRPMNSWMLFRADWTARHKNQQVSSLKSPIDFPIFPSKLANNCYSCVLSRKAIYPLARPSNGEISLMPNVRFGSTKPSWSKSSTRGCIQTTSISQVETKDTLARPRLQLLANRHPHDQDLILTA